MLSLDPVWPPSHATNKLRPLLGRGEFRGGLMVSYNSRRPSTTWSYGILEAPVVVTSDYRAEEFARAPSFVFLTRRSCITSAGVCLT